MAPEKSGAFLLSLLLTKPGIKTITAGILNNFDRFIPLTFSNPFLYLSDYQ